MAGHAQTHGWRRFSRQESAYKIANVRLPIKVRDPCHQVPAYIIAGRWVKLGMIALSMGLYYDLRCKPSQ